MLLVLGCATGSAPGSTAAPAGVAEPNAGVRFMQGMIVHHQQALEMAALAQPAGASESIMLLAERIEVSQVDEIARMQAWLRRQGAAEAMAHDHEMPGMATAEEVARLRAARGAAFDALFLELMIRHHEGALVMVAELLNAQDLVLEPELFQLASHIDADQRAEIARMRALLNERG